MKSLNANVLPGITMSGIIVLIGTMCGCWFGGNADLESAVYRSEVGAAECSCSHCTIEGFSIDIPGSKQIIRLRHPITKISSEKGPVKDVWVVTINWECDKCSSYNDEKKKWRKYEYSYINKKLQQIRYVRGKL